MPAKGEPQIRMLFSIDEKIVKMFRKKAKANKLNKSKWVETMMKEYIKPNDE